MTTDIYKKIKFEKDYYSEEKPLYERRDGYNAYSKYQLTQILNTSETGYIEPPMKEPGKLSRRKLIDEILRRKQKILDNYDVNYDQQLGVSFGDYHKIPMSELGNGSDRTNDDGFETDDEFTGWSRFATKERGKNLKWKRVSPNGTNLTVYRNGDFIIAREIGSMYQPWKLGTVDQYLKNDMKMSVHGNIKYLKEEFEDWVFDNQGGFPKTSKKREQRGGNGYEPQNEAFTPFVSKYYLSDDDMEKVTGYANLQEKVAGINAFANVGYQRWDDLQGKGKRTGGAFVFKQALPEDVFGYDKRGNPIIPKRVKQNEFGSIVSNEVVNVANPDYSRELLGNYGSLFHNKPSKGFNNTKNGFYFMDMVDEKGRDLKLKDVSKRINFNTKDFQFKRTYGDKKGQKVTYKSRSAGDGLVIWKDKELARLSAKKARDDGWLIRTVRVANGFVNLGAKRKHYPSWHPMFSKENKEFLERKGVPWLKSKSGNEMRTAKRAIGRSEVNTPRPLQDELAPGVTINKRNFPSGKPTYYRRKKR